VQFSLAQVARQCNGQVLGDSDTLIKGVASLEKAGAGMLSLYSDRKYRRALNSTQAGAILTTEALADDVPGPALLVNEPLLALAKIMQMYQAEEISVIEPALSTDSSIAESATLVEGVRVAANATVCAEAGLAEGVEIGAGSVVGRGVKIGANTRIDANVTIYAGCLIGQNCHISSGSVIGADGFGFAESTENEQNVWLPIPQAGIVIVGNNVHIGANTTIDRGSLDDTVIEDGVIIDNLVQIAHNVKIGRHTAIAGCVAIAGSAIIGANCKLGGRAAIIGHLSICDEVVVFADSLVTKSITEAGVYSAAMPAMPIQRWRKLLAKFRRVRPA